VLEQLSETVSGFSSARVQHVGNKRVTNYYRHCEKVDDPPNADGGEAVFELAPNALPIGDWLEPPPTNTLGAAVVCEASPPNEAVG